MKSAEEWVFHHFDGGIDDMPTADLAALIRRVQRDALKAAAVIIRSRRNAARNMAKEHENTDARDWSGVMAEYLDGLFREINGMAPPEE